MDKWKDESPFGYILLISVQMLAMAFAVLVICNMLLEPHSPPVPQCPLRPEIAQ